MLGHPSWLYFTELPCVCQRNVVHLPDICKNSNNLLLISGQDTESVIDVIDPA